MSFTESVKTCLVEKYADVNGRATRSEYWWFFLFQILLSLVSELFAPVNETLGKVVSIAVLVGLLLPGIAVAARRLHDIDKSGWFQLIGFIPVIGWIWLLVLYIKEGTPDSNRFGEPVD